MHSGDVPVSNPFVHGVVRKVLDYDVELIHLSFYIGNIDLNLTRSDRYLLKVLMSMSEKSIMRQWLYCSTIQCIEGMTFNHRRQKENAFWNKWDSQKEVIIYFAFDVLTDESIVDILIVSGDLLVSPKILLLTFLFSIYVCNIDISYLTFVMYCLILLCYQQCCY